jgi:hypothetical protein
VQLCTLQSARALDPVNGLSNQHHFAPLRDFFTQAAMSFCGIAQPPVLSRWLVPQGFCQTTPRGGLFFVAGSGA